MEKLTKDQIKLKTIINEKVFRDGKLVLEQESKNLTPDSAVAAFIKRMGGDGSTDEFTYLALGTGTTAAANDDTALESEIVDSGLERASATVTYETDSISGDTLQLLKSWTATGSKSVTEIGVFNDASAGTLGGRTVKTAVPLESNDVYHITYKIILARA
jgi:hypothetical protein